MKCCLMPHARVYLRRSTLRRWRDPQRFERLLIDLDPTSENRFAVDQIGRTGTVRMHAHAMQQAFNSYRRYCDEAPRAALTQRLGPRTPDAPAPSPRSPALPAWLGALVLLLLLGEWASRRARGRAGVPA